MPARAGKDRRRRHQQTLELDEAIRCCEEDAGRGRAKNVNWSCSFAEDHHLGERELVGMRDGHE
jgi:hypothetical protein